MAITDSNLQKEKGDTFYRLGNYRKALEHYNAALCLLDINFTTSTPIRNTSNSTKLDRQRILSNIVLCRLNIHEMEDGQQNQDQQIEEDNLAEALKEAEECVELNKNWAKGHYRLGCVLAKMEGKSNDACNALQVCLRLDPGYREARNLMVKLLRQRDGTSGQGNQFERERNRTPANDNPTDSSANNPPHNATSFDHQSQYREDIDETLTMQERAMFHINRMCNYSFEKVNDLHRWFYHDLDDTKRGLLIMGLTIVFLYVGFGGRFGLSSSGSRRQYRGNYGADNAYNNYNSQRNRHLNSDSPWQSRYDHENDYSSYRNGNQQGRQQQYSSFHLFDGSVVSMGILLSVMYAAHTFFGINPFQLLWALRLMTGHGGGFYFGGGPFGGGMRQRRYGRNRGGWF